MPPWSDERDSESILSAPSRAFGVAAIVAVGLAAYANTFSVGFVLDDYPNVVDAARVHAPDLAPGSLAPAVSTFPTGRWLAHLSFAVNHAVGGLAPAGYHVVNLAFHLGAALLVLLLAREVLGRAGGLAPEAARRGALLAALVFVAHPVQTQAVTYVVQRMTSMGGFFAVAALLLHVRARGAPTPARRALALGGAAVSAFLAFSSKENYALVPALALLLEGALFPGLTDRVRRHARAAVIIAAVVAALGALAAWQYTGFFETQEPLYGVTLGERLLTQPRVLWHYLSLLALPLPSRLQLDHAWTPSRGLLDPPSTLIALVALVLLVVVAWALRRRVPLLGLAVAWFLVGLAVEQSVIPLDFVFEHRLYLPALGWFILAAWALERAARAWRAAARLGTAAALVATLGAATFVRNAAWNDPARLYAGRGEQGPAAIRNQLNLAQELLDRGELGAAEGAVRRAMTLSPASPDAFIVLGGLRRAQGDVEGAVAAYQRAASLDPAMEDAWDHLALTLYDAGRLEEAEAAARGGMRFRPDSCLLHETLGLVLQRKGDVSGARRAYERAVQIDPGLWSSWGNLAEMLLAEGRSGDALGAATRFAAGEPSNARAQVLLARALAALGRGDEARGAWARALSLDPSNVEARRALGR